jgi:hypothetical protein
LSFVIDRPSIRASATVALVTALAVIILGGYYESPLLLALQIALIAGPTFLPLALLPRGGPAIATSWVVLSLIMLMGWGYVVHVDTRPYTGGGASFAILFGWFACFIAGILAATIMALVSWFSRSR